MLTVRLTVAAWADTGACWLQPDDFLLRNDHVEIWNLVYAGVCVLPLLYSLGVFILRLIAVGRRHMHW